MKKRILSLLLVLVMVVGLLPTVALAADETPSVSVYFSLTDDAKYVVGNNAGEGSKRVMAYQKLTVPYFDLKLYGLEDYYFSSETYGPGQSDGADPSIYEGKVTLLHMIIYALERDYCNLPENECGKGYLKEKGLMGTTVFNVSGSSGSFFMQNVWGHDLNLLYYLNYAYPLASAGYGSTADQILLRENDVVSMSLYTDWSFYSDDAAGFHHLGTTDNQTQGVIEAKADDTLDLVLYRSSVSMGDGTTQATCGNMDVYCTRTDALTSGDVTTWTSCGKTDENGAISIDLEKLGAYAGDYIFSVAGQANSSGVVVSCPGGTLVSVKDADTPPVQINYLRNVSFASEYEIDEGEDYHLDMTPQFSPDTHDYTIIVPDMVYTVYPTLTFRGDAPDNLKATFEFTDLDGEEQSIVYDPAPEDDAYWEPWENYVDTATYEGTTLTLTVAEGTASSIYTFKIQRLPTIRRNTLRLTSSLEKDAIVYGVAGFTNTTYSGYTTMIPYGGAYLSYEPLVKKADTRSVKVNGQEFASGTWLDTAKLWEGEIGSRHFDLTISLKNEDPETVTTTYTVVCTELPTGLSITQNPTKTTYAIGESLDPTGMVVSVQYEGGAVAIPNEDLSITPERFTETGDVTVTVSYAGLSAELTVKVEELALRKGSGTEEDPYLLENADDLKTLSALVASGNAYAGCYFRITDDITLPDGWTPIGGPKVGKTWVPTINKRDMNLFSGYIDGAKPDGSGCYTITIPKGGKTMLGGIEHASLSNLNFYGEKIDGYGVVEYYSNISYGNTPSIIMSNVTLKSGSHTKYSGFIGGYASGSNDVILRNCTVEEGVIVGDDGTFPEWAEELTASYPYPFGPNGLQYTDLIGSFGGAMSGTIENCVSHAKVYGRSYVGGIMGFKGQSMGDCIVRNCVFDGEIHATGSFVGGITGGGYSATSAPNTPAASIENCVVTGSVTGANYVGGIFGGEELLKQCWNNGIGYIRGNYFNGTVQATAENGVAGGIIGYMHSLDCYNVISNNYYITGSAARGIGKVNEANVDLTDGAYGRKDDPLGEDADKLTASFEASDLTDGTLVSSLNAASTGSAWTQGASAPMFSAEKRVVRLKSTQLNTMSAAAWRQDTGYYNLDGKNVTVTYSDGTTKDISATECAVSGLDFTKTGYQLATLTYEGYQIVFGVNVVSGGSAPADPAKKPVSVTVLGDAVHEVTVDNVHTLAEDNLTPWILNATVLVDNDATALSAFDAACTAYGLTYVAKDSVYGGKYISSVTSASGMALTDESNKQSDGKSYSGWMYSVDGTTPSVTMDKAAVTDSVVVYFEDDYSLANVPAIIAAIDALPTPATEEEISAVEAQLEWLSPVAREKVTNLQKLIDARNYLAAVKVIEAIDAIGEVTEDSGDVIHAARSAYDGLTKAQQEQVTNYETLLEAEARYSKLTNPVELLLEGPETLDIFQESVNYKVSARNMQELTTITMQIGFRGEGLTDPKAEALDGWYIIAQTYENGVLTVVAGHNAGVTGSGDLLSITAKPTGKVGQNVVSIRNAVLSGYDGSGEIFMAVDYSKASQETETTYNVYDVNHDGVVNQLDVTRAQRHYGTDDAVCDVNHDGVVDIADLILILNNYTK